MGRNEREKTMPLPVRYRPGDLRLLKRAAVRAGCLSLAEWVRGKLEPFLQAERQKLAEK